MSKQYQSCLLEPSTCLNPPASIHSISSSSGFQLTPWMSTVLNVSLTSLTFPLFFSRRIGSYPTLVFSYTQLLTFRIFGLFQSFGDPPTVRFGLKPVVEVSKSARLKAAGDPPSKVSDGALRVRSHRELGFQCQELFLAWVGPRTRLMPSFSLLLWDRELFRL